MRREPDVETRPNRDWLVPYERENPDPRFTPEMIRYIESCQAGLTARDHAKLDELEWFTLHKFTRNCNAFAIPGLRAQKYTETRYVRRYNAQRYWAMINAFLACMPPDTSRRKC